MATFFENLRSSLGIETPEQDADASPDRKELTSLREVSRRETENSTQSSADNLFDDKAKTATGKQNRKKLTEQEQSKKKQNKRDVEEQTWQKEAESEPPNQETTKIAVMEEASEADSATEEQYSKNWFESEGELAVDVYQTDNDIVVQTAIAGVRATDLDVTVENDVVTIRGIRKNPLAEKKQYVCKECFWGAFSRQIILPEEVDASHSEASMKDGVLTLRMPKMERVKMKKIKVQG